MSKSTVCASAGSAASYSRFSSDLQSERSITDQQRKCRDRAARDGQTIAAHQEFKDEAISGAKHDRGGFEAMLQAARQGRFTVLYIESLSRLARDCVLTLQTLRELVYSHHVRLVSIDDGIDTGVEQNWELMAAVFGVQNEQYLKNLARQVFRGQEGLVRDGYCVGDCCFGYTSEPIEDSVRHPSSRHHKPKKRYVVEPTAASWVKRIFAWYVEERRGITWITQELNRLVLCHSLILG
jgi:site-specific DNA recombinase